MPERFILRQIKKFLLLICTISIASVGLSACTQGTNTPTFQNSNPITVGISLSLSGSNQADGVATQQGYQLWADTVNAQGGLLGRPVKFVILDDKSDPNVVGKNYETLISTNHVDLVFGPFSTLLTKPASIVANNHGYAMIEGEGGGPSVFTRGLHNIFDVSVPVANNLSTFALFILSLPKSIRPQTAAYVTEDDPFTQPQVDLARSLLEQGGVKTVFYKPYSSTSTKDYTSYADSVIASNADVVVMGTLLPDASTFINRFRQKNYKPKSIIATAGPDLGTDFIKAVGGVSGTEGVFVPNGWYPQANTFQNAKMVSDYLAKYGGTADNINGDVAESYSVGQVLQQVVTSIHSINNKSIMAELHSGATFASVQGSVQFDGTGQNTLAQSYLFQWQHGQFLSVYPNFVASENPEYPKQ